MLSSIRRNVKFALFPAVSFISFATLLFEVLLSRILAVTVWYHFGFAIVSLAMLGVSLGAILCPRFKNKMSVMAGLFAIFAVASIVIHLQMPLLQMSDQVYFWSAILGQLSIFFLTFIFSGICLGAVFIRFTSDLHKVYFFDMVGASLGCLCLIPLLFVFDGPSLIFIVFSFGCIAALGFAIVEERTRAPVIWLGLAIVGLGLFYINQKNEFLGITKIKSYEEGEFQKVEGQKIFEKWSPVSRVAVFESDFGSEALTLTADAGAPTRLRKFDGNYAKAAKRKKDCRQIGQRLSSKGNVLVIGSGGGADVLMALALKKEKITAVDINPVTADLVKGKYSDYIGNIFHDPKVTLHVQDGRNFVAGTKENYDLIHITMVDSWTGASAGAFVFNENNLYTKEAIKEYIQHLNPNGVLSITRYSYWGEGLRLVNTIVESLEELGIKNISERLAIVQEKEKGFGRVTVLLKNGIYSDAQSKKFAKLTEACGGAVVFAPQVPTNIDELNKGSKHIYRFLALAGNSEIRKKLVSAYNRNIEACTDDQPFFFFTTKISTIFSQNNEHASRRYAILGLLALLGTAFLYSVAMTLATAMNLRKQGVQEKEFSVLYFALIGAGFMIIEISFTQKLTVLLGHPAWSFLVALTSFLLSSACGSYFSKNAKSLQKVLAAVVLIIFIYQGFLYDQMSLWMGIPLGIRVSIAMAIIFPLGFFMGMCFPMGIRLLAQNRPEGTATAWALNGAFSVVGSVAAVAIAIFWGFKATLIVGGVIYLIAIMTVWNFYLGSDKDASL